MGGPQSMREDMGVDLTYFLAVTSGWIREFGWVSRTRAHEHNLQSEDKISATADEVWRLVSPFQSGDEAERNQRMLDSLKLTEKDTEAAEAAIEWASTMNARSDYDFSIQVIAKNGNTTYRQAGYAGSILTSHRRKLERDAEYARQAKAEGIEGAGSQHQGSVKERIEREVRVTTRIRREDYDIVKLLDRDDNVYTTFTCVSMPESKWFHARMTVKRHDEYKGVKQTIVNRVAVQKELEEVAA